MKVIDLLNKIANGEEVPKKIKLLSPTIKDEFRICNFNGYSYVFKDDTELSIIFGKLELNDEVELLEEEPRDINVCGSWFTKSEYNELFCCEEKKKIPEKLDQTLNLIDVEEKGYYRCIMENIFKINEIIDYLKSKGE